MSTKIAALCLIFILSSPLLFSQAHLQGSCGFMYLAYQNPAASSSDEEAGLQGILSCRLGVTGDLLVPLKGNLELGAEIGFYGLPLDLIFVTVLMLEIPVDALVRINFTPDRKSALELRGGLWISSYSATLLDESDTISDARLHIGGRLVLSWFYFGADYIAQSQFPSAVAFEAGVKYN